MSKNIILVSILVIVIAVWFNVFNVRTFTTEQLQRFNGASEVEDGEPQTLPVMEEIPVADYPVRDNQTILPVSVKDAVDSQYRSGGYKPHQWWGLICKAVKQQQNNDVLLATINDIYEDMANSSKPLSKDIIRSKILSACDNSKINQVVSSNGNWLEQTDCAVSINLRKEQLGCN